MNKGQDFKKDERVPFSLFHAAVEREKKQQEKQPVKEKTVEKELDKRG